MVRDYIHSPSHGSMPVWKQSADIPTLVQLSLRSSYGSDRIILQNISTRDAIRLIFNLVWLSMLSQLSLRPLRGIGMLRHRHQAGHNKPFIF
jgi:hypothetical protein